jgi:hypothetical protein
MTDLVVIVPSRGRPANVARLVQACALTCRADTRLHFAFDLDDPDLEENVKAAAGHPHTQGGRQSLSGWTNAVAARVAGGTDTFARYGPVGAMASLGDDHVPVTDGWDARLLEALAAMGGGFAYPNDLARDDIPEAVVVSTSIVAALGWFCLPQLTHWYVDNVWRDLGAAAGRLAYCRDVIVRHEHPNVTGARPDATYYDAAATYSADLAAYQRWRLTRMAKDIAAVRGVLGAAPAPV